MKTHLKEAHGVTEETCLPSTILLPANLLRWSCKLCQDCRLKPKEKVVLQHIGEVHGEFFLAKSGGSYSASCRICQIEGTGDLIRQHGEHHRREGFATEEEAAPGSAGGSSVQGEKISAPGTPGAEARELKRERSPC